MWSTLEISVANKKFYNICPRMLPAEHIYGQWPASGEIDIVESRGNAQLMKDGVNIGVEQVSISPTFYEQLLRQNPFAKKLQTQIIST